MSRLILIFPLLLSIISQVFNGCSGQYQPTWASLDSRPLPEWYDKAKIGIFIHWGVFSVPSFTNEWFWFDWVHNKSPKVVNFMNANYPPGFTYADFASEFTATFYDPDQWADLFAASGARYMVITAKHHEGFAMWPSNCSWNWNAHDVGPKRDLLGDLARSIRNRTNLHFGLYYSLMEWFNPLYLRDKSYWFTQTNYSKHKSMPELYGLVNSYQPDIVWSDGEWEAPAEYWKSQQFLAWLYNESPVKDTVVTNDRWGWLTPCHHGGFYSCSDRYDPGVLQPHKWENAMTIDKGSWGYRRIANVSDYITIEELLSTIASTVSCGGNILVNVGPTKDGVIIPIFQERLLQMGQWLKVNGEAIYETVPWKYQNDTSTPNIWYTASRSSSSNHKVDNAIVYAIVLKWPKNGLLHLGAPRSTPSTVVTMLGINGTIQWTKNGNAIDIKLPYISPRINLKWSWVLKFEGLE